MMLASTPERSDPPAAKARLLRALAALERQAGVHVDEALVALEEGDVEKLARVLSTSREDAERLMALLSGPSEEQLDADALRWTSGATNKAIAPRRGRWFAVPALAVVLVVAGFTIPWMAMFPSIRPAEVALQPSRRQHALRSDGPELYCPGEPIRLRLNGSLDDLASILILLQHEHEIRVLDPPSRAEDRGVVDLEVPVPAELSAVALEWRVWIAHARQPGDLPPVREIAKRVESPPRDGRWRLVRASPGLRLECPKVP